MDANDTLWLCTIAIAGVQVQNRYLLLRYVGLKQFFWMFAQINIEIYFLILQAIIFENIKAWNGNS